jgi:hypothetical protein
MYQNDHRFKSGHFPDHNYMVSVLKGEQDYYSASSNANQFSLGRLTKRSNNSEK